MMKGRSDLDGCLQKNLVRPGRLHPESFPGFVRIEELRAIELVHSNKERC